MIYLVDGNNVYGSRPDGWWNNRQAAAERLTQTVAEWCMTHEDEVVVVFDRPLDPSVIKLSGGNLTVCESPRRGRNAADAHIIDLAKTQRANSNERIIVVSSDKGLRARLPEEATTIGVGQFRRMIGY